MKNYFEIKIPDNLLDTLYKIFFLKISPTHHGDAVHADAAEAAATAYTAV